MVKLPPRFMLLICVHIFCKHPSINNVLKQWQKHSSPWWITAGSIKIWNRAGNWSRSCKMSKLNWAIFYLSRSRKNSSWENCYFRVRASSNFSIFANSRETIGAKGLGVYSGDCRLWSIHLHWYTDYVWRLSSILQLKPVSKLKNVRAKPEELSEQLPGLIWNRKVSASNKQTSCRSLNYPFVVENITQATYTSMELHFISRNHTYPGTETKLQRRSYDKITNRTQSNMHAKWLSQYMIHLHHTIRNIITNIVKQDSHPTWYTGLICKPAGSIHLCEW